MQIQLYSDDPFAASPLEKRLHEQGIDYSAYQPGDTIRATHFVLLSPVWCNEQFVTCERIWKKYFEEYKNDKGRPFRRLKFITAGYERAEHDNYLCLLDLPEDLGSFFEDALPSSEDWQPMPIKGVDMSAVLQRFYLGHGKDSVLAAFDSIAIKVRDIEKYRGTKPYEKIIDEENGLVSAPKLSESWLSFRARWGHYYAYAPCLPFYTQLNELEEISKSIHIFFQTGCNNVNLFAENNLAASIQQIKSILEECSTYAS